MTTDLSFLTQTEKTAISLRSLYCSRGFTTFRMSRFEEYDFYAGNRDFLASENILTFTDVNGRLMALKPDVTLSIIKSTPDMPDGLFRICYNENVYRPSKGNDAFAEITQTGVESIGHIGSSETAEIVSLAAESLLSVSEKPSLVLSHAGIIDYAAGLVSRNPETKALLIKAATEKNLHEIEKIAGDGDSVLGRLLKTCGRVPDVIPVLDGLLAPCGCYGDFRDVLSALSDWSVSDIISVDFSVGGDISYYSGIIFKGFVSGIPVPVLSGGRYDNLMRRMGRKSGGIGFAVYVDSFERQSGETLTGDGMLSVALPKGRLGENIYRMFADAGYDCPSMTEQNRRLVFENPEKGVRFFWVKPSDVDIYVERGAADIGVAGKDVLSEHSPDVFELLDTHRGACRMVVAGPDNFTDDTSRTLRVATKYPKTARRYFASVGREIDIIPLNGSIEIAPVLVLSDVIADIVETGTTLRENNLSVKAEIFPVSARVIANKSAYMFKKQQIDTLIAGLRNNNDKNT